MRQRKFKHPLRSKMHQQVKANARTLNSSLPDKRFDDALPTPLQDTAEFKAYADEVKTLVLNTSCGVTQSEINRSLQPPSVDWTRCALEWNFDDIEGRQVGVLTKYFPRELKRIDETPHSNPHAQLFPEGAHRLHESEAI